MKKKMKSIFGRVLFFALILMYISCGPLEKWDNPKQESYTPPSTPNPPSTPTTPAISGSYIVYSSDGTPSNVDFPSSGYTLLSGSVTPGKIGSGLYIVSGTTTCDGQLTVTGEVNLVILDGATLTVNDGITCFDLLNNDLGGKLKIYAQSTGSSMGQLIVTKNTNDISGNQHGVIVDELTIYGGSVNVQSGSNGASAAIKTTAGNLTIYDGEITCFSSGPVIGSCGIMVKEGDFVMYKGSVDVYSSIYGDGILVDATTGGDIIIKDGTITSQASRTGAGIKTANGTIKIDGGNVSATGGYGGSSFQGGDGIYVGSNGKLIISNGTVVAKGGNTVIFNKAGHGINALLKLSGGSVTAIGGLNSDLSRPGGSGVYCNTEAAGENMVISGCDKFEATAGNGDSNTPPGVSGKVDVDASLKLYQSDTPDIDNDGVLVGAGNGVGLDPSKKYVAIKPNL